MRRAPMTLAILALVAGTSLAQAPPERKSPGKPAAPKAQAVSRSATVSVTAAVTKIDYGTREVTLKGPEREISVVAGDEVKNLEKIKVGDMVSASYHVGLLAEARPATAEEKANPTQGVVAGGKAMEGGKPSGAVGGKIKVVTTVDAIDEVRRTITFKGPAGKTVTVEVENPANLAELRMGDTVVFTYTEALAISVEPAGKK